MNATTSLTPFYISPEAESAITNYQHVKFVVSVFLNVLATFCLMKQTPDMQSQFKGYLYYLQLLAVVNDVFYDFAVAPYVLLPVIGGYGKGLLAGWINIQLAFGLLVFLLFQVDCTIIICLSYRHQTIVNNGKKGNVSYVILRLAIFVLCSIPGVFVWFMKLDSSRAEELIEFYRLSWIRERGAYVVYERTWPIVLGLPVLVMLAIAVTFIVGVLLIAHIILHIRRGSMRSAASSKRITRSLVMLTAQLCTPFAIIAAPAVFCVLVLMDETMLSFLFCFFCLHIVNFHSLLHNIVLLLITPAYRRFLVNMMRRVACRDAAANNLWGTPKMADSNSMAVTKR